MAFKIILYVLGVVIITLIFISSLQLTKANFLKDSEEAFKSLEATEPALITEDDIIDLPAPVQKYLRYVGVIGKRFVNSYYIEIEGMFKLSKEQEFRKTKAVQYSFSDPTTRLFYMDLRFLGLKITGYHKYKDMSSSMTIRLGDLFKVVNADGDKMLQGETVTVFNDMCLFAPATLIDSRITWEEIDDYHVLGTFNNNGVIVSATLVFNEEYQLINFISDDRFMTQPDGTYIKQRWETPITKYQEFNGYNIASEGSAIWKTSDGDFEYFTLQIKEILYNEKN